MKNLIKKPHYFFFALIPIFIIIAIIKGNTAMNININDIYFVSNVKFWCAISAIFFCLIGVNYFSLHWAKKPPKKVLTITHILLQVLAFLLLITRNNWNWIGKQHTQELAFLNDKSQTVIFISFLVFLLSILIHLINFFTSLFLKTK